MGPHLHTHQGLGLTVMTTPSSESPKASSLHFYNLPYGNMNDKGEAGLVIDGSTSHALMTGTLHPRRLAKELQGYGDEELDRVFDAAAALLMKLSQDADWPRIMAEGGRAMLMTVCLDTAMIWERG